MFNKIKILFLGHKIISAIIILCVLGGAYWIYKSVASNSGETRYVLAGAVNGTIISSVAGTGQTSAANEIDIKPKTSGDLISVGAVGGQTVSRGQIIAKIDSTDAERAVGNAQQALDQANNDLAKMKGVETSLGTLRGITEKAQDSLNADYENGFNTITNTFLNLPVIMSGLQGILFNTSINGTTQNIDYYSNYTSIYNSATTQYKQNVSDSYQTARTSYEANFADFKATNRTSGKTQIESLITETYNTIGEISQCIKDAINLIQLYQDEYAKNSIPASPVSTTQLTSLNGYVNSTNGYLSSLLSIKNVIEADKENLIQTGYTIADQETLVAQKTVALDDANKNLSYCTIYAPFSGIISAVNVKTGDSVSTGTAIAKIITKDVIANISLNEVDASKVKIGQKVVTTFDAIDGLSLTGVVASIDTIGTVSQGVVSYSVQINFDTQDSRVKPGMSVSVNVITDAKQNVLIVPNSAVKTINGTYYVLVLDQKQDLASSGASKGFVSAVAPTQKTVEIGLSDDTNTEITGGLAEGDQVVVRTISGSKITATTSAAGANRGAQGLFIGGGAGGRPGN